MKFKIFKFKSVTSTNDVALNLIQEKKKKPDAFMPIFKQKGGEHMGESGSQTKEIYLELYFFHWKIIIQHLMNFR